MARVTTERIAAAWQDEPGSAGCRITLMRPRYLDISGGCDWVTWIELSGGADDGMKVTAQDAREIAAELLRLADAAIPDPPPAPLPADVAAELVLQAMSRLASGAGVLADAAGGLMAPEEAPEPARSEPMEEEVSP